MLPKLEQGTHILVYRSSLGIFGTPSYEVSAGSDGKSRGSQRLQHKLTTLLSSVNQHNACGSTYILPTRLSGIVFWSYE